MNNNDKTAMYRALALVLGIAAIVFLILWMSARTDVDQATEEFREDLTFVRAEIARTCTFTATTTDADREECEDSLENLSDILRDYRAMLIEETGTSTMPTSSAPTATSTSGTSTTPR